MPTSSIAQIILRIFALNWFLLGIIQIITVFFVIGWQRGMYDYLVSPSLYFAAGIIFWVTSSRASRALAMRNDGEFKPTGITGQQLYSTTFLVLGLCFMLVSFAELIQWLHYFLIYRDTALISSLSRQPSYYQLTESALTLIAGLAVALNARWLAARLTRNTHESSNEPDEPAMPSSPDA